MKHEALLTDDQNDTIDRLYERPYNLLIAGMGAGKTVCALTAANELLEEGYLTRILVVAPLKVCENVWAQEAEGWSHLAGLEIGVATGAPKERNRVFDSAVEIVVINFELLVWMKKEGLFAEFDGLIVDESTKLKSYGSWFKAIRFQLKNFTWRVAMTGTPVSENTEQLFYQMMLVDRGASLGKNREKFMRKYFYPTDYSNRNWSLFPGSMEKIAGVVSDYVYTMPDYRGELPDLNIINILVEIGKTGRRKYFDMVNGMESEGVLAESAAVQSMKLEQLANGFIYDEDATIPVHDAKREMILSKLGKSVVANNSFLFDGRECKSLVVVYQFTADLDVLRELFPSGMCLNDNDGVIDLWNSGGLPVLFMHPKSGGHGLNLPAGGWSMLWYSPVWSRDMWEQTIARLWRRGQEHAVDVWRMVAVDTVDAVKVARVEGKGEFMPLFMAHLDAVKRGR